METIILQEQYFYREIICVCSNQDYMAVRDANGIFWYIGHKTPKGKKLGFISFHEILIEFI